MTRIQDTARGIVVKDGKILLMERWKDGQHYYSIPGGKIEPDEAKTDTVEREILEETGVKVRVGRLTAELKVSGSTHSIFLCEYRSGEPSLQPDSEEALQNDGTNKFKPGWRPIESLDSLYLRYWEPLKPMLVRGLEKSFTNEPVIIEVS